MIKKILFICLITALLIGPVAAEQITIEVDSKRIEGYGCGKTPLDVDDFCLPIYLVCDRDMMSYAKYIEQEYPVSYIDYYKIQLGQKITLEFPDSPAGVCKVVSIQ